MDSALSTKQAMRYSRQIVLADFDLDKQERLLNSKVLMVGVGGLGCAASQYLVASGIGAVTLVDDDTVELTNLQRQVLHTEQTVGRPKVESAAQALSRINNDVQLTQIATRQTEAQLKTLVAQHDIVLDCTDNLHTRNLINQVCYQQRIALVSGAAIRMEGQLFSVIPQQESACYACISRFFGEQNLSCMESGVMSPVVGIIGASQALEAIKILTQYGTNLTNRLQLFDAMNSSWQTLNVLKQPDCGVCGQS